MVNLLSDRAMTANIEKLVDDAKKVALRLRDRIVLGGIYYDNFITKI